MPDPTAAILWFRDLLLFRVQVTPWVLMLIYYAGALGIPVLVYELTRRFRIRLARGQWEGQGAIRERLLGYRARVVGYAVAAFLMAELAWRMLFEFIIAYFQMHEALLKLSGA